MRIKAALARTVAAAAVAFLGLAAGAWLETLGVDIRILPDLRRSIDPRDRALLDQLAEVRGRLSNLTLKGAGKMDRQQYRSG